MPYRALQGLQDWSGFPVCSDFPTYLALCTEWFVTRALIMKQTDLTESKAIVYWDSSSMGKLSFLELNIWPRCLYWCSNSMWHSFWDKENRSWNPGLCQGWGCQFLPVTPWPAAFLLRKGLTGHIFETGKIFGLFFFFFWVCTLALP